MSKPWQREDIRRARQTNLKPVLEALGYRLHQRTDGNQEVVGLAGDVIIKQHYWIRLHDGTAGNAIDFLVKVEGRSFNEAMRVLMRTNRMPSSTDASP